MRHDRVTLYVPTKGKRLGLLPGVYGVRRTVDVELRGFFVALMAFASMSIYAQSGQIAIEPGAMSKNPAMAKIRVEQHLGTQLPLTAEFKDESGKTVHFGDYFGKRPVLLMPIFYQCTGVCTVELQGMIATLRDMKDVTVGKDLDVVAVSINPREGPDLAKGKLASVIQEYGRPETAVGWHFLVGNPTNIHAITDPLGFFFVDDPVQDWVNHPSGMMILTPKGIVSRYLLGVTYDPKVLRPAIAMAGQDEIGTKSQELFFGCVHVDGVTGKRTLVIEKILKVGAAGTVVCVVLLIAGLSARSKKKAA